MTATNQNRPAVAAAVLRGVMAEMTAAAAEPFALHGQRDRVRTWRGTLEGVVEGLETAAPDPDGEVPRG